MSAAQRLAALDTLDAADLCSRTETALTALVDVMNAETTLLRAGHYSKASALTASKAQLAQDYVGFARSVQRQSDRLKREAPAEVDALMNGHERLATQMAENLRVIGTARAVSETLLTDVAQIVGQQTRSTTYGKTGQINQPRAPLASGLSFNRAL